MRRILDTAILALPFAIILGIVAATVPPSTKIEVKPALNPTTAAAACANETFPVTGTIHYVCDCQTGAAPGCVAGSDSNAGTSTAAPWQTWAKGMSIANSMSPGDTTAFCNGGSFTSSVVVNVANFNSIAANPVMWRDYRAPWGPNVTTKPKITGASAIGGMHFINGGGAVHDEGYRLLNLDFEGTGQSAYGIFFANDITDAFVCNVTSNNYIIGVYVANSNPPVPPSDDKNSRIVIQGSTITNNSGQGYLGACTGCELNYNVFQQNGGSVGGEHGIYIEGAETNNGVTQPLYMALNERVVGNQILDSNQPAGSCNGTQLVVHGMHQDMVISDNTFSIALGVANGGCYGIGIAPGYADGEQFVNIDVTRNVLARVGQIGIWLASCNGCEVSNNLIVSDTSTFGIVSGNFSGSRDPSDGPSTAANIINNTFYMSAGTATGIGVTITEEGTNHVSANNSMYFAGTGPFSCYRYTLPFASYNFIDNNNCYSPSSSTATSWENSTGDTLAQWQSASGFDAHSFRANPKFRNVRLSGFNFHPNINSPLVNKGNHANAPVFDLMHVTRTNPPDIGAYQRYPTSLFW